ncbi:MAG TPA: hypothetical protein VME66_03830 [Candidatus Acidoferrales bacterium]|nr:hypothetical protein [Candidatus Acidoferrales bacterium]
MRKPSDQWAEQYRRPEWQSIRSYFNVFRRPAANKPLRRIESHRFTQHRDSAWEGFGGLRRNRIDVDLEKLPVQPRFHCRMFRKQVARPGQRIGRRLVTGEKQRHRFVAHLPIVQFLAPFRIARSEQRAQGVSRIATIGSSRGDESHHHAVELLA